MQVNSFLLHVLENPLALGGRLLKGTNLVMEPDGLLTNIAAGARLMSISSVSMEHCRCITKDKPVFASNKMPELMPPDRG